MAVAAASPAVQDQPAPRGAATAPSSAAPRRPAPKLRGDGHTRDPQRPVAGKSGADLDFDDPSVAEAAPPAKKPAKQPAAAPAKPKTAENGRRAAPQEQPRKQARAIPPESTGGAGEANDVGETFEETAEDPYEKLAQQYDAQEGKRPAKPLAKVKGSDPAPKKPGQTPAKPVARRAPAETEVDDQDDEETPPVDDELEVGDEIEPGEADDQDDEETNAFTHPILRDALEYGFSEEEAREFGTPELLQKAMSVLDKRLKELGAGPTPDAANVSAGKTPADGLKPGETLPKDGRAAELGKTPAQSTATETAAEDRHFKKLTIQDLDPESFFGEETRTVLTKVIDHYDGIVNDALEKVRSQKEQFDGFQSHIQERERARFAEEQDDFFKGLGEDFADVFGESDLDDLDPESSEAKNRHKFVEEMSLLAKGLIASGKALPSRKKLRERILRGFEPAVAKREKQIRQETVKKERKLNKHRIAEPTTRGTKIRDKSPEDAAGDFADEFMAGKGFRIDPRNDDDDNDI